MAEIMLFHHVLGRTTGMQALAERFRLAGHTVWVPDLFEGRTFTDRLTGRAYVDSVGFDTLIERGRVNAEELPHKLVYVGVSLGALPAQLLTQTRPGAQALVAISAVVEPSEFEAPWPADVPMQVHLNEDDPLHDAGDLDTARNIAQVVPAAELYLYPGATHTLDRGGIRRLRPGRHQPARRACHYAARKVDLGARPETPPALH